MHGLRSGFAQIEDREPAVAEGHGPLDPAAVAVGATVGERVGHRLDGVGLGRAPIEVERARDAAHG